MVRRLMCKLLVLLLHVLDFELVIIVKRIRVTANVTANVSINRQSTLDRGVLVCIIIATVCV